MDNLTKTIEESFIQYSAAVLQSRALVDVRDGLKPSARQIFYSMLQHKLTCDKPHKKTANAVGMAMADYYIHGDASCVGIIMRAGQPFAMRYPLIDVKGNAGSLIESGNYAAPRYTESRLSKVSDILFKDIDKETIKEWRDNYDNTKQFPTVLPSKGFFNICNGVQGIGVGLASSIPQYNIRELNNALIHLIQNKDCDFEEIYCAPDFATGGILYNENEVKESMKKGTGAACKIRSKIEFDEKERCFVVTELPYNTYSNTVCKELEEIELSEDNYGIESHKDLTHTAPLIKIYLNKKANINKALQFLYKNTSLQNYYGINFTALEKGRFPRVFTWKEMLQAHIDHEREVYRNGFLYEYEKIKERLHIIDGLLKAIDRIEEVIRTIRAASDTTKASLALQSLLGIDAAQAKAILDIKLAKLAHLEYNKYITEKEELEKRFQVLTQILNDSKLLDDEVIKGLRKVADELGDARRTKIINEDNMGGEIVEKKQLYFHLTNLNNLYPVIVEEVVVQRRGGVGKKIGTKVNEYVIQSILANNTDNYLCFSNLGRVFSFDAKTIAMDSVLHFEELFDLENDEKIINLLPYTSLKDDKYIVFITKNGIIKKTHLSEYNIRKTTGVRAIKFKDEKDKIIYSFIGNGDEDLIIMTSNGRTLRFNIKDITPIGRVATGVIAIRMDEGDFCIAAQVVKNEEYIITITNKGNIKKTPLKEIDTNARGVKGHPIQKLDNEKIVDMTLAALDLKIINIISSQSNLAFNLSELKSSSRAAGAITGKKLKTNEIVLKIVGGI